MIAARLLMIAVVFVMFAFIHGNCGSSGIALSSDGGPPATSDSTTSDSTSDDTATDDSTTTDDNTTDEGTQDTETCTETGDSVTTGEMTATINGTPCNAPLPTSDTEGELILGCNSPSERNTDDAATDYVTVSCGTGDGATSKDYYCVEGIVYSDNNEDGIEISETATVTCDIDENNDATLSEEELIIS